MRYVFNFFPVYHVCVHFNKGRHSLFKMAYIFMTRDDAMTVPKIYLHTQGRLHVYPLFGSFWLQNEKARISNNG